MVVEDLMKLCLTAIKADIVQHARNWIAKEHGGSLIYEEIRMRYHDWMVFMLSDIAPDFQRRDRSIPCTPFQLDQAEPILLNIAEEFPGVHPALLNNKANLDAVTPFLRNLVGDIEEHLAPTGRDVRAVSAADYNNVLNFILSPYVLDVQLTTCMNEIILNGLANNCVLLRSLSITNESWDVLKTDFLKSLVNLVILEFCYCFIPIVPTMAIIADYLVNLTVLHLYKSSINNDGLLILCGHQNPCGTVPSCAFTKHCSVSTKVKLRSLVIEKSQQISREVMACVLTHIPTLERLEISPLETPSGGNQNLVLSEIITEINETRKEINLPILQFQIERLEFLKHPRIQTACLAACPKLHTLCLDLADEQIPGRILVESELSCLKVLHIKCLSISQISGEEFGPFWTKNGSKIQELYVSASRGVVVVDVYAMKHILASCRNLEHTELVDLEVPSAPITEDLEPRLSLGNEITLRAQGEIKSVANLFYELISCVSHCSQEILFGVNDELSDYKTISNVRNKLRKFIDDTSTETFRKISLSFHVRS